MGLALFIISLLFQTLPALSSQGGWRSGRATYYGEKHDGTNDGFSIHHGSCQFGALSPDVGTGWDIAALPDVHPEYQGSCGTCYEIACEPMVFKDNYGESLDRTDACIDVDRTVTVTIVDVCPCNYPRNQYNNKRWCCGDMDHFDMSMYAYEKIGAMNAGVIGIKYRPVPCPGADDIFVTAPPEALTMPPFPSNGQGVSNIKNVRKAIKEASGEAVVISEVGQTVEAPKKPSAEPHFDETPSDGLPEPTEKPSGKPTPHEKSSGDAKPEKPSGESNPDENFDEARTPKVQWKPVMIRPKISGEPKSKSSQGSIKDDSGASQDTRKKGTKSNEDDKDPSSVPATGPSVLLAALLIVVVHWMAQ